MRTLNQTYQLAILLNIILCLKIEAQDMARFGTGYDYNNTIGLRIGETSGISYKHFFNNGNAFEGIVSAWPYTFGATGLYEKHLPTLVPGLKWYFGGGGHFNSGGHRRTYYRYYGDYNRAYAYQSNDFATGVDGIIGVEYKFKEIPLALSTDLKPYTEINNSGILNMALDPGIGVKFTY